MLLEIIFKGFFSILNLGFLPTLLANSKDVRFNVPENSSLNNFEEILKIFQDNEYADLAISTDEFHIGEKVIPRVFINLTKDSDYFEMLVFFDFHHFIKNDMINSADEIMSWANSFQKRYKFDYYVCQIDNADEEEYYFDSNGLGPLYDKLS